MVGRRPEAVERGVDPGRERRHRELRVAARRGGVRVPRRIFREPREVREALGVDPAARVHQRVARKLVEDDHDDGRLDSLVGRLLDLRLAGEDEARDRGEEKDKGQDHHGEHGQRRDHGPQALRARVRRRRPGPGEEHQRRLQLEPKAERVERLGEDEGTESADQHQVSRPSDSRAQGRQEESGEGQRGRHTDDEDERDRGHLAGAGATPDEELRVGDDEDRRCGERREDEDVKRPLAGGFGGVHDRYCEYLVTNGGRVRHLAYLDPGSGSVLLQALLGGVAAIAITGKLWWHRLLTLLHIRKPEAEEAESASPAPDESGQSRAS